MINFNTKSIIEQIVESEFPQITNFRILYFENVEPVISPDYKTEYPPVVRWSVGNNRFSYVLKPEFAKHFIEFSWWMPFDNKIEYKADYNKQHDTLLNCLRWSVEGKTAEEINHLLGNL